MSVQAICGQQQEIHAIISLFVSYLAVPETLAACYGLLTIKQAGSILRDAFRYNQLRPIPYV